MTYDLKKARPQAIFRELGTSGLSRWDTKVSEEFLPELRGASGRKILHQMGDCDATLGAILYVYRSLMSACDWEVRESTLDKSADSKKARDFVEECINDMSTSWESTVANFSTFLQYGFSVNEIVFKKRLGRDAKVRSEYSDGMIGLRKLPGRSQRTITDWAFDSNGGIRGCWQKDEQTGKSVWLPIEKFLLFRTEDDNGNPEGKSILASSYLSWYFIRNYREILGIGIERDLHGIPVIRLPAEIFTNAEYATELQNYKNLVANIRADEMAGVLLPMDPSAPELYKLELLSAEGKKSFDVNKVIQDLKMEMASATLTDLMFLGQSSTGSYALSRTKQEALNISVYGYLSSVAAVINRHLIPKLMEVNPEFKNLKHYPTLYPRMKKLPDYKEIAELVRALAFSSFHVSSDLTILNSVLDSYGLPTLSEDRYKELSEGAVDNKIVPGEKDEQQDESIEDNEDEMDRDVGGADALSIE